MRFLNKVLIALTLSTVLAACAEKPKQVPYYKMSCKELKKEIQIHQEAVESLVFLEGLAGKGNNSSHFKYELDRAEKAFYAKGCHK